MFKEKKKKMKTIVIAGAESGVGKTTLAREIRDLIPGVQVAKIGHGQRKPGKEPAFYPCGTPFVFLAECHAGATILVVESNSIIREMQPDMLIFLSGKTTKPSAIPAKKQADIVSGTLVTKHRLEILSRRLDLGVEVIRKIAWLAGVRPEPVTAIILAGGKSSRMGTNKALLTLDGMTIIEHLCHTLLPWVDQILVSGAPNEKELLHGIRHVRDREGGMGPMMGLSTGLEASTTRVNVVVACDMPEVNVFTLRKLLSFADEYEIVVPSVRTGTIEPLHGVYTKTVEKAVRQLLAKEELRLAALIDICRSKIIRVKKDMIGYNLNDPEEYQAYVSMWLKKEKTV